VYLSATGYMFSRAGINIHCILLSVNGQPTPTLEALAAVFQALPDGSRTSVTFHSLTDRHRARTGVITVDKRWFPFGHFCLTRDPVQQHLTWDFEPAPSASPAVAMETDDAMTTAPTAAAAAAAERPMSPRPPATPRLRDALVMVSFDVPYLIDGVSSGEYVGAGVIVDKRLGLVLVDRATAPITLGDALITFGGALEVAARVVFVHPMQNFSILQYDPRELAKENGDGGEEDGDGDGDGAGGMVAVAEVEFVEEGSSLQVGDSLVFHGLNPPAIHVTQRLTVTKKETLKLGDGRPPMFVGAWCACAAGWKGVNFFQKHALILSFPPSDVLCVCVRA
jgi:pro-apoptotic serine protease NMA111